MPFTRRTIEVTLVYDDSGESYYLLPSGFPGKFILVNESPVDLEVRHVGEAEAEELLEKVDSAKEERQQDP